MIFCAGTMGRSRTRSRVGHALMLVIFAGYLATITPHSVHHLFEHDVVESDCPFAPASERQHAASVPIVALVQIAAVVAPAESRPDVIPAVRLAATIDVRGPPVSL